MPQFDILTLGAQISSLLFVFIFFYFVNIKKNGSIPLFIQTKKFRTKKLKRNINTIDFIKKSLTSIKNNEKAIYFRFFDQNK